MKLFLDLEDTIINSWQDPTVMEHNIHNIKRLIKFWELSQVSIFSFAIYDDLDKETFVESLKINLEEALGVKIVEWLSVKEMQMIVQEYDGVRYDNHLEFIQLKGKHGAFIDVCLARENDDTCVLIDDCVPMRVISDYNTKVDVHLIPVDKIDTMPVGRNGGTQCVE